MMRGFASIVLVIGLAVGPSRAVFSQSAELSATFEIADIHGSPRSTATVMRASTRPGRYELDNATMLDLVRTAYGFDADKILGGPNWLEYDRFDVIAKIPSKPPDAETLKLMLQNLLADRFKLVVRKDTQQVPGLVLTLGKGKPKLKESDGKGETGCKSQPQSAPTSLPGVLNLPMTAYSCHNMTMEAFAAALRNIGTGYVTNAVVESTGLKGAWDFDLKWTQGVLVQILGSADAVTLSDAIDKQLGLKLEEQKIPTPVLVVDRVNQKPTDNAPDIARQLPPSPPVEFEVADIKPSAPITSANQLIAAAQAPAGFFPGGRVNLPRFPLMTGIMWAWNLATTDDIINPPKWLSGANFDIVAKAPADVSPVNGNAPLQDLGPMLQALFIDRFKMKAHFEDRQVNAYTLVAAKPKLKKADPTTRTGCKTTNARPATSNATPFGINLPGRVATCQNITMAQFADQLQVIGSQYVHYPVADGTGLEGAWDFSFTFSLINPTQLAGLRGAPAPGASDPVGGTSLLDALEKQLGLKLEMQKRSLPVFVIDHMEEKPTEN